MDFNLPSTLDQSPLDPRPISPRPSTNLSSTLDQSPLDLLLSADLESSFQLRHLEKTPVFVAFYQRVNGWEGL